jgi:hypothetical protein
MQPFNLKNLEVISIRLDCLYLKEKNKKKLLIILFILAYLT